MTQKFNWVDYTKAIALIWIALVHVVERAFGPPIFSNPNALWPPLDVRIAQMQPLQGYGLLDIPINLFRYIGWSGDQGVQLFLILSGFGVTWGLLSRNTDAKLHLRKFYMRRFQRIYPQWWMAHIFAAILALFFGSIVASPTDMRFVLSMLGIRLTPEAIYYIAPAWWYVCLIVQLYLVYPVLLAGLKRLGPTRFLIITLVIAFCIRGAGLLMLEGYLDFWSRGGIFITRLPEFAFGMVLAAWFQQSPTETHRNLTRSYTILLAFAGYVIGFGLSFTLIGMTVAPFLLGLGAFIGLYAIFSRRNEQKPIRWLTWVGVHSFSLFLMHHLFILIFVPQNYDSGIRLVGGMVLAATTTLVAALMLEWSERQIIGLYNRYQLRGSILRLGGIAIFGVLILIGAELVIRQVAPQEINGWGERPALEPHDTFGWRLKPSTETQLRWASYDYLVQANSLGFPGVEYPPERTPGTYRIMATGDAFSSAEGVDTALGWLPLVEARLGDRLDGVAVEVLNFSMTGYGPNQYATVVEVFASQYQPDHIIVEFFVNDLEDVMWSNELFQQSIGFFSRPQDDFVSIITLSHLRRWIILEVVEPVREIIRGTPRPNGYFLGNFQAFERDLRELAEREQRIHEEMERIQIIAQELDVPVTIVMVPASIQVCEPGDLAYYPTPIDLTNVERYDLDQPQRIIADMARSLNWSFIDLRPALIAAGRCPYQPHNMHWLDYGHELVAEYVANFMIEQELVTMAQVNLP